MITFIFLTFETLALLNNKSLTIWIIGVPGIHVYYFMFVSFPEKIFLGNTDVSNFICKAYTNKSWSLNFMFSEIYDKNITYAHIILLILICVKLKVEFADST
jgi:hypothetical protein